MRGLAAKKERNVSYFCISGKRQGWLVHATIKNPHRTDPCKMSCSHRKSEI